MNEILPITDEDLSGSEVVNTEPLAEDNSTDAEAENIASGVVKDENLSAVSDEKKSSQTPEADVNNEEPLTAERISEKVKQLKVGEEFTYVTTQSFAWGSGRSVEKKTYTWQRNEDGTLTCTQPEVVHSSFGQVVQSAKTVYSSDKQRMISRDMAGVAMNLGLLSTQNFDENGKITSVTTDLTQMNTEGYSSNAVHFLHRVSSESRHPFNYKQQEFCNKDGDIILSCKEGKFYNAKGKESDVVDATKILRKAEYKQKIGQLIQYPS